MGSAVASQRVESKPKRREIGPRTKTQGRFLACAARAVITCSERGQGKTFTLCMKAHVWATRYPGTRVLVLRAVMKSCRLTTMYQYREHLLGPELFDAWFNQQDNILRYPNGSEVMFAGLDDTTSYKSGEFSLIAVDEIIPGFAGGVAVKEAQWEELKMLLRCPKARAHQICGATNPGAPTHWIKTHAKDGRLELIEPEKSGEYDSYLQPGYVEDLNKLSGIWRQRYRLGLWVAPQGLVFEEFRRDVHATRTGIAPPHGLDYPVGVDFGFNHAFAAIHAWNDPRGKTYVHDEVVGGGGKDPQDKRYVGMGSKTNEEWAGVLEKRWPHNRYYPVYADHDPDAQLTLAKYCPRILKIQNAAKKDNLAAINTLKALFAARDEEGEPMIYIDPVTCPILIREIESWCWKANREGEVSDDGVDKDNHCIDGLLYRVHSHSGQHAEEYDPAPVNPTTYAPVVEPSIWTRDPYAPDSNQYGERVIGAMR